MPGYRGSPSGSAPPGRPRRRPGQCEYSHQEPGHPGNRGRQYTACGGDFYARGHIRAIAEVMRIDSAPLIREYDRVHRAPGTVSRVSLDELLATSAQGPYRRQPSRLAAAGLVASARSSRQRLNLQAAWTAIAAFCALARRKEIVPAEQESAVVTRASASRRRNWAGVLGLAVAVALGFAVYRVLAVPPHAAVIPPTGQAATDHPARHARPDQAPHTSHESWAPSPSAGRARAETLPDPRRGVQCRQPSSPPW